MLNVGFKHNRLFNCVATEFVHKLASFLYIFPLTIRTEKETNFLKLHVENCEMQPQLKNIIYITVLSFEFRCIKVVVVVIVVVVVVVVVVMVVVSSRNSCDRHILKSFYDFW